MKKDYYDILGVSKNDTPDDIQRAYRRGARSCHPDVNREADAEERFKLLNEAHGVLSDSTKKKLYDRYGDDWEQVYQYEQANGSGSFEERFRSPGQGFSGSNDSTGKNGRTYFYGGTASDGAAGYEDILKDIFGGSFGSDQRFNDNFDSVPEPVQAELILSLDELIKKSTKTIAVAVDSPDISGSFKRRQKKIQVKIPQGVTEGSTIRLKEQGQPSFNNGKDGDLLLRIRVEPDSRFVLSGYDLLSEVAITPWEAALGTKVDIETTNGQVRLNIPAGTQSGRKFRLKNKGLAKKQGSGDLLIAVKIMIPDSLSDAEKELFEELAARSSFDPRATTPDTAFTEAA